MSSDPCFSLVAYISSILVLHRKKENQNGLAEDKIVSMNQHSISVKQQRIVLTEDQDTQKCQQQR